MLRSSCLHGNHSSHLLCWMLDCRACWEPFEGPGQWRFLFLRGVQLQQGRRGRWSAFCLWTSQLWGTQWSNRAAGMWDLPVWEGGGHHWKSWSTDEDLPRIHCSWPSYLQEIIKRVLIKLWNPKTNYTIHGCHIYLLCTYLLFWRFNVCLIIFLKTIFKNQFLWIISERQFCDVFWYKILFRNPNIKNNFPYQFFLKKFFELKYNAKVFDLLFQLFLRIL